MNDNDIPMSAPNLAPCTQEARLAALMETAAFMLVNKPEMTAFPFTALVGDDMLDRAGVALALDAQAEAYRTQPKPLGDAITLTRLQGMEAILEDLSITPAMRNNRALEVLRGQRLVEVEAFAAAVTAPTKDQDAADLLVEALHAIQQLTLGQCRQSDIDPSLPQRIEFALRSEA